MLIGGLGACPSKISILKALRSIFLGFKSFLRGSELLIIDSEIDKP